MTFAVRRVGAHIGRLSLLALVVLVTVVGIGGIEAVAERMLAAGASDMLTKAEPDARTVRVVALESDDVDAQDSEVHDAVIAAFDGVDIVVSRQGAVEVAVETPKGEGFALSLLDDARLPDLAVLTNGEWPQSPEQIALPDAAAQRQSLELGDAVILARDGTQLVLVGTWIAEDPADPAWHGDPAVASGESDGAIGPAVVADGALTGLPGTTKVTWEIAPADVDIADIPALRRAITTLRTLPDTVDPQRQHNTRILGTLDDTLQRQSTAVLATRGLLIAPLVMIALLGALVLGVVLTSFSLARAEELGLLRARGASGRRLALSAAAEAAGLAAAGAVVALISLALAFTVTVTALLTAGAAISFTAVISGFLAVRGAGRAGISRPDGLRIAGLQTVRVLLLSAGIAVGLAALSAWQLFATGSVVRPGGAPDPLAAAAPALLLIAACALAPVVASPLAALSERLLRGTRGLAPILPLRQISRSMGSVAVSILCLALAAASLTLAVAAPAASDAAERRAQMALLGGDVRMISDDSLDAVADSASTWSGVTETTEILRTPLAVGSDTAVLVAGPLDALGLAESMPVGAHDTIVAVLTRSLADRLGAVEGTVFNARIRSVVRPVSIEVARIVDALPGAGDGLGVAVDPAELEEAGADLSANELWLSSDSPGETAAQLREHATHPVRILTAAQVSAAPVVAVAPTLLTAGAVVTVVLGVIGFIAASSATSGARREEPFILRALGLRSSPQRALRIGETAGVAIYAVIVGCTLGALVVGAILPVILGGIS